MGEWRYSSTIIDLGTMYMEMNGQIHASGALTPGKEPPVSIS
jgi:hypothetical protein